METDLHIQHSVEQFLYRQAEILDAKRWQDYIDLFTHDGVYWMPADPADKHWDGIPSIFAEDKNLMTVRMKRVLHPDAWSQRPLWGTNHVVGNVIIEKSSANGDVTARSRFHMMELQKHPIKSAPYPVLYAGWYNARYPAYDGPNLVVNPPPPKANGVGNRPQYNRWQGHDFPQKR